MGSGRYVLWHNMCPGGGEDQQSFPWPAGVGFLVDSWADEMPTCVMCKKMLAIAPAVSYSICFVR